MREKIEIRLFADEAEQILPPGIGEPLGTLGRKVLLELEDPLIDKVREHQRAALQRGSSILSYWQIHRKYTLVELKAAELFLMRVRPWFEPSGEECGTVYDEAQACPRCKVGARQVGPLRLDLQRIPKRDIAQTLGGEMVVSARLAEWMQAAGIQGHGLGPVEGKNGKPSPDWYQLLLPPGRLELSPRTQVGKEFFVPEPDEARCPGHVLGFTVLSEVFVERASLGEGDWHCTRQALGMRFGLYRPEPLLLISPRLYWLLVSKKVKRFDVEVAHLV